MDHKRPDTLPKNWVKTSIGAIYDVIGGGTPSTSIAKYWGGDTPWITSADIDGIREIKVIRYVTQKGIQESTTNKVPNRTLLVVTRVGLGKIAISDKPICFSQDLQGLVQRLDLIFPEYSLFYLSFELQRLKFEGRGTTISGITKKQLKDTVFPLPPYQEQHRIVAKIEKLFSELDKGIESLKTARRQLEVYRQSVLKHAFEGKLTAQWRKENKDKLEKPEQLLTRIKQEREARYERQLQEWRIAVKEWEGKGKPGKKPAKVKEISQLSQAEMEILPSLPGGWSYLRLGIVINEPKYGTSKKCGYKYEGTGVLRIPNVVRGVVDASDLKGAHFEEDEKRTYALRKGDILVIRSNGSISIVGKCAIISKAEEQYLYAGYLIRLRSNPVALLPDYLAALLSSHLLRTQIEHKAKSTSGVNNINSGEIQSLIVPLCSLSEQEVVVERLSASLSAIDTIEAEIDNQLLKADALRQSVLKKAFAGQLVAQDPNDESASVLLARIETEKEQVGKKAETTRKSGRKRVSA